MDRPDFDPVLLDPTRLSIVSLLVGTEWAEFGWVREAAGLSASALSKQVGTLGSHGYVEVEKGYVGKRPRTWLNLTTVGREALERQVTALQRIVDDSRAEGSEARVLNPGPGERGGRTARGT
ncbi:winged helix-turn-helix domain-containing protein [Streptomyces sp. NPDC088348]|uniref:winged helix-turn-helix domain-containing protein n=1 Tax=Streptomyces sp. NPDC088348 TaxID=3365853 RepID=UPI00380F23CB